MRPDQACRHSGASAGASQLFGLLALVVTAAAKGMVQGTWLQPWELGLAAFVTLVALTPVRIGDGGAKRKGNGGKPSRSGRRRGLPKR